MNTEERKLKTIPNKNAMIVNYTEKGWEVITQRMHGVLAAQLAIHWKFSQAPDHWIETILAIAEHDDAQMELDGENLLTDAGGPLNFSMKTFDLKHCEKLSAMSLLKSRYIALLTSMHMDFLYNEESAHNPVAKTFLQRQRALRSRWCLQLSIKKKDLDVLYSLLEWCDACSLLLCQRQLQPQQRRVQISTGPKKQLSELIQVDDKHLTIDPWPFESSSFPVSYESRLIKQLHFTNSAAFRKSFLEAPVTQQTWIFNKS